VHQTRKNAELPEADSRPGKLIASTPRYTQGAKLLFDFFKRALLQQASRLIYAPAM
jgi:hypothetical protein